MQQHETVFVIINSSEGDLALRRFAWDLLARNWALQATYYDGADIFLTEAGKEKITSERTLALLCPAAHVDQVFASLSPGARAIAMPVLRVSG